MSFYKKIKAQPVLETSPIEIVVNPIEEEPTDPTVSLLQVALVGEYQQWDLYTAYASRLQGQMRGEIVEEFKDHAEEELAHIELLQRYLVSMGQNPTLQRKALPDLPENATIKDIVQLQIRFEQDAVDLYKKILNVLPENDPLTLDIEGILLKEQEHVHDLELLLDSSLATAGLMFRPMEAGESTKPQAGYGCGCGRGRNCNNSFLEKVQHQWCMMALQEITPDIYARWYQGKVLSTQEKDFVKKAITLKGNIRDRRAILRFLDSRC